MILFLLGFVCATILSAVSAPRAFADQDPTVAYRVSPSIRNGVLAGLEIEVRFRGDPSGVTTLDLPDRAGGHRDLWKNLRDLTVTGALSVGRPDGAHRTIKALPSAPLTVSYRVVSGIDHEPTDDDVQPFTPWIRPRWFYVIGGAVFVTPHDRESAAASFDWNGAPTGFAFASDLQHLAGKQRKASRPGTVDDVRDSVMLGGWDVKLFSKRDHGALIRVAIRGTYLFSGSRFFDLVREIIDDERDFWGDGGAPFLVTLGPVAPQNASSMSGTGRTGAFLLAITPDVTLTQLKYLLAHEYFHTWNPRALGTMPDGPDQTLDYWFSEGFTDFYARRLDMVVMLIGPLQRTVSVAGISPRSNCCRNISTPTDHVARDAVL
jgi:predicted metalloprotease with PDZ domain